MTKCFFSVLFNQPHIYTRRSLVAVNVGAHSSQDGLHVSLVMSRRAIFGEKRRSAFAIIDSHESVSKDKPRSSFHESDYHIPRNNRKSSRLRKYINIAFLLVTFLVASTLLATTLAVRLTGYRSSLSFVFTLGDTYLFKIHDIFCDQATLVLNTGNVNSSVYLLSEKPPQTKSHFEISTGLAIGGPESSNNGAYDYGNHLEDPGSEYVAWRFYLYAGSVVEVDACVTLGTGVQYLIIEGDNNFEKWKVDPGNQQYYLYSYQIPGCASGLAPFDSFPFTNDKNGNLYYFVFCSMSGQQSVDLRMVVNRLEYTVAQYTNLTNCTAEGKSNSFCKIDIAYGNYAYAMIEVSLESTSGSLTYGDPVLLEWVCDARDWIYAIIFFIPFLFIMFIVGIAYTYCYCKALPRKNTSRDRESLVSHYQTATLGPSLYSTYQPLPADPKTRTL